MTWSKVDDNLSLHPKALAAGNSALGLWVRAGSCSAQQLTDGFIPRALVAALGGHTHHADALITAGLWERTTDGYRFTHDDDLWDIVHTIYRPKIPSGIRAAVYDRDGHICLHCGTTNDLTLDHIYPWSLGGPDVPNNLQTLCRSCNMAKGATV